MATKYTIFTMAVWLRQHLVQSENLQEKLLEIATNNQIKRYIYIQTFDTYCLDSINSEKCKVINACQQDLYETKPYLSQLRSANVRSMFTKMRIDANCTLDSQLRSFRNTKTKDPLCKECNDVQSVTHVLLTCKNKDLTENRTMFENKICKHVYKYPMFSTQEKL